MVVILLNTDCSIGYITVLNKGGIFDKIGAIETFPSSSLA